MSRIDVLGVVRAHLQKPGTPLFALVGRRVYKHDLPSAWNNETALIVIFQAGGAGTHKTAELDAIAVTVRCYGGSAKTSDAEAVERAVHDVLHGATDQPAGEGVITSSYAGAPINATDSDTEWPAIATTYETLIRQA